MGILESLSGTESAGNFGAQNNITGAGGLAGHFGRLQFGQARLKDAERAGVLPTGTTPQQFLANPQLQQAVEQWHLGDMRSQAQRMGLDKFIGSSVGGTPITMDSILAMGHLGGIGGARKFLESGGSYNPSDAYGTSLSDYASKHGTASAGPSVAQAPQQSVSTSGAPQMAMPPQAQQAPQGILGMLGVEKRDPNSDNLQTQQPFYQRDRFRNTAGAVATGLNSLRLNPDQQLGQQMQSARQGRQQDAQTNRTREWLSQQPNGAQFVAMLDAGGSGPAVIQAYQSAMAPKEPTSGISVGGNVVDPITGRVIYQGPTEALKPTSDIQNYEYYKSQELAAGRQPKSMADWSIMDEQAALPGPDMGKFSEEAAKYIVEDAGTMATAGSSAARSLRQLDVLESALSATPGGTATGVKSWLGKIGIKTEGLDDIQLADALISQLVPAQRPPGSGTMSDADLALFKASLPALMNTPDGNTKIISTMRAIAEYDIQMGNIARKVLLEEMTPRQAFDAYASIPNPLADFVVAGGGSDAATISDDDLLKKYGG